ncbi:MAG: porphobilinogen synthase [Parachlamydiaceae bacterium]
MPLQDLIQRPRRLRRTESIRQLVEETHLLPHHLVSPLFVVEGSNKREPISSLPEVYRHSIDTLLKEIESLAELGVRAIDLFPYIPKERKDSRGSESLRDDNLIFQTVKTVKRTFPELCLMVDVALDPYTDHGHDGIINADGVVLNDETVEALSEMSLRLAEAGTDVIAPSDMMDGRVKAIRNTLDAAGFTDVAILSYAAKYASALYSPFRDALHSAPKFGDKKSYQMNPANSREALKEAKLDEEEGADILLVKPALSYLDIISKIKTQTTLPVAAYHVSGEYAMVMAAHEKGWLNAEKVFKEQFLSIRRAGADFIFTYAAKHILN